MILHQPILFQGFHQFPIFFNDFFDEEAMARKPDCLGDLFIFKNGFCCGRCKFDLYAHLNETRRRLAATPQ